MSLKNLSKTCRSTLLLFHLKLLNIHPKTEPLSTKSKNITTPPSVNIFPNSTVVELRNKLKQFMLNSDLRGRLTEHT